MSKLISIKDAGNATQEKPGPKAESLKVKGNWKDAVKKSLQKKKPPKGWPK